MSLTVSETRESETDFVALQPMTSPSSFFPLFARGRYSQLSSIAEKVMARHPKSREDMEATKHLVEETEQALASAKAREAELLQVVKVSKTQVRENCRLGIGVFCLFGIS